MGWNTIQDYINDPAGFEATHQRFKAQQRCDEAYKLDACVKRLKAVVKAARAVMAKQHWAKVDDEHAKLQAALDKLDEEE